ncbi:Acetyl esterase/lipase [Halogeometricum limi]|uniref:Acetyl esterase/lipase n=1 Tax=Halogeometricum limi TaxID=555875 RepID=A0A1I6FTL0_9EURY|nr:Acetyl esterase/lipase [Halogeometricum limi]
MTDEAESEAVRVERDHVVSDHLRVDTYRQESAERAPVVVFVYGGGWESGARGQFARWALDAASDGYLAVEVEYRLSDEATFPAQIRDVRACLSWVRDHAAELGGDPNRVAVFGHSAGAHLALLAALAPAGRFGEYDPEPTVHAAVGVSGLYDLREAESDIVRRFLGGARAEESERYDAASPVAYVSADAPPTLLLHGEADETVPVASSEGLAGALDASGAAVRLRTDPGADHVYLHSSYWYPEIRETVLSWLRDAL